MLIFYVYYVTQFPFNAKMFKYTEYIPLSGTHSSGTLLMTIQHLLCNLSSDDLLVSMLDQLFKQKTESCKIHDLIVFWSCHQGVLLFNFGSQVAQDLSLNFWIYRLE